VKAVSVKVPDPSVVPTPFSKKQPPPKDSPTAVALLAAALNSTALAELGGRLDGELVKVGRDSATLDRYLNLDSSPRFSLTSVSLFEEMVGRAGELGFTDVITHWPRPDGPYAGDVSVLETVASDVIPQFR